MERKLVIRGTEHVVDAPSRGDWSTTGELFAWITVDGTRRSVEIIESGPHHLDLLVDGKRLVLHTAPEDGGDGLWVSVGGRARLVTEARRARKRGSRGADDEGHRKVTPLFPATVVNVMVAVGDEVKRGQPLVVVSAMKMEMTLSAPFDGKVTAVNVVRGAAVGPGDELVVIDAGERGAVDG